MVETRDGGHRGRSVLIGVVVVMALVIAGLAYSLLKSDPSDAAVATLEPAAQVGADPFTDSVAVGPVTEFPGNVEAINTSVREKLTPDPKTKVRVATGTTAGLYGGTTDTKVCNPAKLVAFLKANPAKAKAWAQVMGISPTAIPAYVGKLTPVLLTSDTVVTNHGFRDGRATTKQSVLQAGTAVMVDATGTPRVKCNCGNPLGAPAATALSGATVEGTAWPGYSPDAVVEVRPGTSGASLTVTDVSTGDPAVVPVGAAAPAKDRWVATEVLPASGGSKASTVVITSDDGKAWTKAATITGFRAGGLAWGDGTWVAVGLDANGKGVAQHSTDLTTWKVAAQLPAPVSGVAFGAGLWVAVGSTGSGTTARPVLLTSPDATTWTQRSIAPPQDGDETTELQRVAFMDGTWYAKGAQYCAADDGQSGSACTLQTITSTDGLNWAPAWDGILPGTGGPRLALTAGAGTWVEAGEPWIPPPDADGLGGDWLSFPIHLNPDSEDETAAEHTPFGKSPVDGLAYGRGLFMAVSNGPVRALDAAPPGRSTFFTSPDAQTWTEVGTVPATVTALAFGGSKAAASPGGGTGSGTPSGDIRSTDWKNRTYDVECDGTSPVTLANGSWTAMVDGRVDGHLTFEDVVYGDLTGAPGDEAAVYLDCFYGASGHSGDVAVFAMTPNGPTQVGSGFQTGASKVTVADGRLVTVEPVFADSDPRCCPSSQATAYWRLDGDTWTQHPTP